ncbi:hypothetical protein CBR_g31602 [Chara braunii]|uniref:Uncharacterized protein n=1 Tax=Chara braunii TaxID=69332 RepID=A0A388LFF6_CHABU|nr:hypothetical protein CBR_g31602 [Chara braunii]|eukprot:GBG81046.1 hypothetical protein CBR_g31602 [Chara braunii]
MDFDIRYRKHERHENADGLTRLHQPEKVPKSEEVIPWNDPKDENGPRYGQVEILSKEPRQLIVQELVVPLAQLVDDLALDIVSQSDESPAPHVLTRTLAPYLQWTACLEEPGSESALPSRQEYLKPSEIINLAFYPKQDTSEEAGKKKVPEKEDDAEEETSEERSYSEHSEGEQSVEEEEEEGEEEDGEEEEDGSEWEALLEEAARTGTEAEDPEAACKRELITVGKSQLEFTSEANLRINDDPTRDPEPPKPEDGDPATAALSAS